MKRFILLVLLVIIALAGWYGYHEYNRKTKDLSDITPDVTIDAISLINAFDKDSSLANKRFTDKIVQVSGNVKEIDANGTPTIFFLGSPGQISSVKCSMDSTHANDFKSVKTGMDVVLKGKCSGGQTQEMFGTDVTLNYCVLSNQK